MVDDDEDIEDREEQVGDNLVTIQGGREWPKQTKSILQHLPR